MGGGPARPALPTATLRPRRAPSRTTRSPHPTRSWAVLTPSLNPRIGAVLGFLLKGGLDIWLDFGPPAREPGH